MSPEQINPPEMVPNPPPAYQPGQPGRISSTERTCQIVYLVFGIIEALIVIRILLKLLAANPNAGFSSFIYGITQPFVAFFQGVFPIAESRGSIFELSSVLAIVVYALLAYAIVRVIRILSRRQTPDAV